MLSIADNERLTQVGPGTPMGTLMRRYWHPIAASVSLNAENPTKEVRLLGEDLVLFRSAAGDVGLIEPSCPHRKANLSYGVPEPEGIRCAYHGWLFDVNGNCIDQPSEPVGSRFKDKVKLKAYLVEELGGLIFAYLGPTPAPLLPRYDILVWPGVRQSWSAVLPCNWLQCQENSLDPLHFQWLHRYWGGWKMNRLLGPEERDAWNAQAAARGADHRKIGFEKTDYGVIKRRLVGDETEESDHWKIGHPILFPQILYVGGFQSKTLQYRVPIDDEHTLHFIYYSWRVAPGHEVPHQDRIPYKYVPCKDEFGRFDTTFTVDQDKMAWETQGPITDRSVEHLSYSDRGVVMLRRVLKQQIEAVQRGEDPIGVYRDPDHPLIDTNLDEGVAQINRDRSAGPAITR